MPKYGLSRAAFHLQDGLMYRLLAILLLSQTASAQTSVINAPQTEAMVVENPVAATGVEERLAGFAQRRALSQNSFVGNAPFRSVGPTVMSGRVVDLEAQPGDPATFYVAYASGGLWKTTSNGTAFTPLFHDQASMTIGDIAVDWNDPEGDGETIWIGTGENNSSRSSYAGTGVYKSTDGGETWEHLGLSDTHHIGRIILHPDNPDTAWVAALGHLYSPNPERGVFKTTDGGQTWTQTLFIDEETGVVDLAFAEHQPDVLYAASWTRTRRAWDFTEAGGGSGMYRSDDGGETWALVTMEGNGFPAGENTGRIGLAVSPTNSEDVWAIVDNQNRRPDEQGGEDDVLTRDALRQISVAEFLALTDEDITAFLDDNGFPLNYDAGGIREQMRDGIFEPIALIEYLEDANSRLFDTPVIGAEVYRSRDSGRSWERTHDNYLDDLFYSYGYYFGQIRVSPHDHDRLYIFGVPILASSDGGATWEDIGEDHVHVDHHALYIDPDQRGHLINGNDGGVNISFDDGESWAKANVPPVGQFYAVAYDMAEPYNVYGGLQDNGVWVGSSTTEPDPGWVAEGDYPFERLLGGDGMQVAVDPHTNRTVYTGFQFGNYYRIDRDEGEYTEIGPRHELGERPLRFNWQSPIHLSEHNSDVIYFGSNKLHRSLDRGDTWETLSDDLTQGGQPGDVPYGTLTTIDESPLKFGQLWVGTDDGMVHLTRDGGFSWRDVSGGFPPDYWVSRVEASNHEVDRAYVALNGYRWDNFEAHVYRTDDFGASWRRIGLDLPAEPVNVIVEDPVNEDLLYVGTDHGVYVSFDRGAMFMGMAGQLTEENALPNVPVHDLKVHPRDAELIVGTHGRSIYIADVKPLQQLTDDVRAEGLHILALDDITHSDRWGRRGYAWGEPSEPETTMIYWASEPGSTTIRIAAEDGETVHSFSDEAEAGLNYVVYNLVADAALADDQEPGEDTGLFYLVPGVYTATLTLNGDEASTTLTITEPATNPERGRKKTP